MVVLRVIHVVLKVKDLELDLGVETSKFGALSDSLRVAYWAHR